MSEVTPTPDKSVWNTPISELLRGRITGPIHLKPVTKRLDWRSRLAELPAPAGQLIGRIVKRTRLWRGEKSAVAEELIAHFLDGLDNGVTAEDLVGRFGDERTAAKLIRRAKRRGRPLAWHVWIFCVRAIAGLICIYLICLIRFCIGGPTPSVNYIARLNETALRTPEVDRAWPLWRNAFLELSLGKKDGALPAVDADTGKRPWPETVAWLSQHALGIETARRAGMKPSMGFVLGSNGSAHDPELFPGLQQERADEPVISLLLPQFSYFDQTIHILSLDAKRAAESKNAAIVGADLSALLGLARQLRESDGPLHPQGYALVADSTAVRRLQQILLEHPDVLSNIQLIQFAHSLCGPRVAGDLVNLNGDRYVFDDAVQRIFTDDGTGDGRLTLKGARAMVSLLDPSVNGSDDRHLALAFSVPGTTASRAELQAKYDQLFEQSAANFRQPLRQVDGEDVDTQRAAFLGSPVVRLRYLFLANVFPSFGRFQAKCERYLGSRDGTLVAIALELYHRQHGGYPASLHDLTPDLLPEIPADRITGDPVKYRLIDGKPIVYSVGVDRIDDGGRRVEKGSSRNFDPAAQWEKLDPMPHGDWVLYPPAAGDDD